MTATETTAQAERTGLFARGGAAQSSHAATVTGSAEKLAGSIREITMQVQRATLTVARAVDGRVSADAELGPQQAEALLAAMHGLMVAVQEMKNAVTRTARGSVAQTDRRVFPRIAVDLSCRVETSEHEPHETRLVNLSEGGACFKSLRPLSIGSRGKLLIENLRTPVDFIVLGSAHNEVRVAFAANQDGSPEIRKLLQQKGRSETT